MFIYLWNKKEQWKEFFLISMIILLVIIFNCKGLFLQKIQNTHSSYIVSKTNNYQVKRMDNITFHYKNNISLENILEINSISQGMINKVNKNLGYKTIDDFNMIIYPNLIEMNIGLRLSPKDKTLGAYYGGNIFLLSPEYLNKWDSPIENIILHEYTHLLVDKKTKGNYPIWFTEGLALYQEYTIMGYEWGEGYNHLEKPYTIDRLTKDFNKLDSYKAYRSAFLKVRFIREEYGEGALIKIMDELGKGYSFSTSIKRVLKLDNNDLENYFMLWYDSIIYDKL